MEAKISRGDPPADGELRLLVQAAAFGDQEAALKILSLFEADIERLSRFMRMPRDEAKQALTLELLELIRRKAEEEERFGQDVSCAETRSDYANAANNG